MTRTDQLNEIVQRFDLNTHPFYVDWRAGTLPVERMRDYAAEWAPFIGALADGWQRLGHAEYADEEREHDELWAQFRTALGAEGEMRRPQSETLHVVAANAFKLRPEALGALYAFEVQQPATAQSKLAGLDEHYALGDGAREYFVAHAAETDEPALIARQIEELSDGEFARAKTACGLLSAAAWGALDGVYYD